MGLSLNISQWSARVPPSLQPFHFVGLHETRTKESLAKAVQKVGLKVVQHEMPAVGAGGGLSGGVALLAKRELQVTPCDIPPSLWQPAARGRVACGLLRLRKVTVLLVVLYLWVGQGLSASNLAVLSTVRLLVASLSHPCVVMGGL